MVKPGGPRRKILMFHYNSMIRNEIKSPSRKVAFSGGCPPEKLVFLYCIIRTNQSDCSFLSGQQNHAGQQQRITPGISKRPRNNIGLLDRKTILRKKRFPRNLEQCTPPAGYRRQNRLPSYARRPNCRDGAARRKSESPAEKDAQEKQTTE